MERDGIKHRADVVVGNGKVLELQASPISVDDIRAREAFYGEMAWLFRCTWFERLHFGKSAGFWWKHAAVSQAHITKPLFWDLGREIVQVHLSRATEGVMIYDPNRKYENEYISYRPCHGSPGSFIGEYLTNRIIGRISRRWTTEQFVRAAFGGAAQ